MRADIQLVQVVIDERTSNVARPAIDILGCLVAADSSEGPKSGGRASKNVQVEAPNLSWSSDPRVEMDNHKITYEFDRLYDRMQRRPAFFPALAADVEAGDLATGISR